MNLKIGIISALSTATFLASAIPSTSYAAESTTGTKTVYVSQEQVDDVKDMLGIIQELEQSNLNMNKLSDNKQKDIDSLSEEARQFYYIYKQVISENGDNTEKALTVLATYYQSTNNENTVSTPKGANAMASSASIGAVKKYNISNAQIVQMTKDAGLYGGTWAVLTAVAKAFGKSPTVLTAMLIAVPVLGMAALNKCNKYDKGVTITDVRVGATHSFSCAPRK